MSELSPIGAVEGRIVVKAASARRLGGGSAGADDLAGADEPLDGHVFPHR